jgi:hypothetical protein
VILYHTDPVTTRASKDYLITASRRRRYKPAFLTFAGISAALATMEPGDIVEFFEDKRIFWASS